MIGVEIIKLVRRPRTWVSILLLCLLPTIVAVLLSVTKIAPPPDEGPAFLSVVLGNGALFPVAALGIVLPIFLPAVVAIIAGDSIAGEASGGTLRYLLVRPVRRTHLLAAKLIAVALFVLLAVVAVGTSAYFVGTNLLGTGAVATTTVSGTPLSSTDLAFRTVLSVAYIAWSVLGVAAVAMFLSTVTDSGLAAAMGGLAVLVASTVLVLLDAAQSIRDYLPTRYWLAWADFFREPILWHDLQRGVTLQGVYLVVLLGMAWANFTTRDITS